MRETSLETNQPLSGEQKLAALNAVLQSQTFARADQLKCFLKYVCEMEITGRGSELTECRIGVEALGKPSNYSPGDDSAVRTRAFALRKKLLEFYEQEQPNASVRIELHKGSYCPHFIEHRVAQLGGQIEVMAEPPVFPSANTPATLGVLPSTNNQAGQRKQWKDWLIPFSTGAAVTALLAACCYKWVTANYEMLNVESEAPAQILKEAWGPLMDPKAKVLLCVANPPSFSVLPGPFSQPPPHTPLIGERPLPPQLYDLYATRYAIKENLYLTATTNAAYWGDVLGALAAYKTLFAGNVSPQLFPEMITTMPTLRHRNVIFFGAPSYSPTVARLLDKCPLQVKFLDAIVADATQFAPVTRYALKRDKQQRLVQVFGLVTVLSGEMSTEEQTRTLIFSGVNSAGTQAATEFFSSPEHLIRLKDELIKAGHNNFPSAYQVVVRAETDDSILLNFHYETFRIVSAAATN